MRRLILPFCLIFTSFISPVFSQSNAELLRLGDASYDEGRYASASHFYLKLLTGQSIVSLDKSYPYELKNMGRTKKLKRKKTVSDSLAAAQIDADSSVTMAEISVQEDSATGNALYSFSDKELELAAVMYRLADSYRKYYDYENAEIWYKKLAESASEQFTDAKYWYGNTLMKNEKYDTAATVLNEVLLDLFETGSPYFELAEQDIKKCVYSHDAIANPNKKAVVAKADTLVNTGNTNFATAFYDGENEIIFTSARRGSKTPKEIEEEVISYKCDLYTANWKETSFSNVENFGAPVNTFLNEGAPVRSPDGTRLFFTRWGKNLEGQTEASIWVCKFLNGIWLQPKRLDENINLPGYQTKHPALSPDGATLYFSSNRPEGQGGFDLWYCEIDAFEKTEEVKNLGKNVNTKGDESTPFFHIESNMLYFSSDGHIGLGGMDIFRTSPARDFGLMVENMGVPINSSRDDVYFILDSEQRFGLFTSDRDGCTEFQGGSCYSIYTLDNIPIFITMSGYVYDVETNEVITNSLVFLRDVKDGIEPLFAFTNDEGFYEMSMPLNFEFFTTAQKIHYFKDGTAIATLGIEETTHFDQDFYLKPIPEGDIVIPGIEYDYDKATLRPKSKKILDDLVDFLILNDHIIIEISSHTDVRGSDEYNMKLSHERAKSVVDYLIANDIPKDRLVAQGYGESKLLVEDAQTEEEHQRNRRTAFRTLSEDYMPAKKFKRIPKGSNIFLQR